MISVTEGYGQALSLYYVSMLRAKVPEISL